MGGGHRRSARHRDVSRLRLTKNNHNFDFRRRRPAFGRTPFPMPKTKIGLKRSKTGATSLCGAASYCLRNAYSRPVKPKGRSDFGRAAAPSFRSPRLSPLEQRSKLGLRGSRSCWCRCCAPHRPAEIDGLDGPIIREFHISVSRINLDSLIRCREEVPPWAGAGGIDEQRALPSIRSQRHGRWTCATGEFLLLRLDKHLSGDSLSSGSVWNIGDVKPVAVDVTGKNQAHPRPPLRHFPDELGPKPFERAVVGYHTLCVFLRSDSKQWMTVPTLYSAVGKFGRIIRGALRHSAFIIHLSAAQEIA